MNITAQFGQLCTAEKISTMEYLWDDLCRHADGVLPRLGMARYWHSVSFRSPKTAQFIWAVRLKKLESAIR